MKFEQIKGWKMAGTMAAVAALGALAPAQSARGERYDDARKGQALTQVSLENDMRYPDAARRKIILERPAEQRQLEFVLKMRPNSRQELDALMPVIDEMDTTLTLANGTPGGVAVIHLDTRAPEVRRAGGTRIVGFFDEDGQFSVEVPAGFNSRDVFAHGEELVRLGGGGHAVPASKRPATDDMSVDEAIAEAYHGWARYYAELYTNLQFKSGGMRSARLAGRSAIPTASVSSSTGLSIGVGHAQPGSGVDDDTDIGQEEVFIDLPNPVGGSRAFGKIALQRPRKPAIGGGHTLPGSGVDDDTDIGEPQDVLVDPADPIGGKRAFGKIKLERPRTPAQSDGHALQRKL